jgi:glutamate--cysteine ligase catalytic subunit
MVLKNWPLEQIKETNTYLDFLTKRARGLIPTGARFIRDFVLNHPLYKRDSVLTQEIAYDLVSMIDSLESGDESTSAIRRQLLGS